MVVKKKINALNKSYNSKLEKIQKGCRHKWIDDGTDVQGWRSVKCYKCSICGKTKP